MLLRLGADVLGTPFCLLYWHKSANTDAAHPHLAVDDYNNTVLHWSAVVARHQRALIHLLIRAAEQRGAQLAWLLVNSDGHTAAQLAWQCGLDAMGKYLEARSRGESGKDTWIGHGFEKPFPFTPLLKGGRYAVYLLYWYKSANTDT